MTRILTGASAAALSLLLASAATDALAQARGRAAPAPARAPATTAAAPAAAPAGPPITHGPPLTGVCVLSRQGAVGSSSAGKAANTRLEQLAAQVRAEVAPQETTLQNDAKAFQTAQAGLSADARQKQGQALQQRAGALQQLERTRGAQLDVTRTRALQQISARMGPIAQTVYQSHNCSILLNGDDAVFATNPAMDLTSAVVAQLNAQLPTLTFDLAPPTAVPQGGQ